MALKVIVFFAFVAAVSAGVIPSALRIETPVIASLPSAVKYEIPPTSRVEHLSPVITTSYGYSTLPLKHEVVAAAPAVKIEAAPVAVAAAPITTHVEIPAVSRVEHLAPAVASSYKTEVITAPKVHVTHTPAVHRIDHFAPSIKAEVISPAVAHVAPLLRSELIAAPAIKIETPSIATFGHLAPSHLRTELFASPAFKLETSPLVHLHTPTGARIEHLSPAVHFAPALKSHYIAEPTLRFDVDQHHLLKHLTF